MLPIRCQMKTFTMRLDDDISRELERVTDFYALKTDADTLRFLIRKEHRMIEKEEKEKLKQV